MSIKNCFEVLSLFFVLAVMSVVMIYGKFEQGVEDFWKNGVEEEKTEETEEINLDSQETSGEVSDFYKQQLIFEYMETKGETEVFKEIFELYTGIE